MAKTDDKGTEKLDPMTEMSIKLEKLEKANAELMEKFNKQSDQLAAALDSNMKLYGQLNESSPQTKQSAPSDAELEEKRYQDAKEEIVKYYQR